MKDFYFAKTVLKKTQMNMQDKSILNQTGQDSLIKRSKEQNLIDKN